MTEVTREQKIAILESNGWQTLWHHNYWIHESWLKTTVNIDMAGISLDEAFNCVIEGLGTKAYYNQMTDNHPTIHSNRFPCWEELTSEQKSQWREQYRRSLNGN